MKRTFKQRLRRIEGNTRLDQTDPREDSKEKIKMVWTYLRIPEERITKRIYEAKIFGKNVRARSRKT